MGLLRTADLVELTYGQLNFLRFNLLHVVFPNSKGAKFSGAPESVQMKDARVIRVLHSWALSKEPGVRVFDFTYVEFAKALKTYAHFFDVASPRLTPHGVRRGGATWFFRLYGNYDTLAAHGRWCEVKNARQYVDEAMSDQTLAGLSPLGAGRVKLALGCLPQLLASL